ncbi:MAG: hypothetical protein ABI718_03770 [Acidobacteriota bacterium]
MTSSDRLAELLNLALDGSATEQEQSELNLALADSTEARAASEELNSLGSELDAFRSVEPPVGFTELVMDRLRGGVSALAFPATFPQSKVSSFQAHRRRLMTAVWAVAAAVVLVIALYPTLARRPAASVGAAQAAGSIGTMDPSSWPVISRTVSRDAAEAAVLTIRQNGDHIALQSEMNGRGPRLVQLRWDPAVYAFLGSTTADGNIDRIDQSGLITFPFSGRGETVLLVRRSSRSAISPVSLFGDGVLLLQKTID